MPTMLMLMQPRISCCGLPADLTVPHSNGKMVNLGHSAVEQFHRHLDLPNCSERFTFMTSVGTSFGLRMKTPQSENRTEAANQEKKGDDH